jgi:AraC family transcriptional regulator of adaptative response/methylated-DNA-[protein]-cysteine methyltransferase
VNQRWVVPPPGPPVPITELDGTFPDRTQAGIRFSHAGSRVEYAFAFFDGFNHLPNIELIPTLLPGVTIRPAYPSLRSFGGDAAVPTPWFTIKVESAYFTSTTPRSDEYVLYVVQLERQAGEWSFVGGYAGQHVTQNRALLTFAPDRGLTEGLRSEYPAARIALDRSGLSRWTRAVLARLKGRQPRVDLPVDVQATSFQWQVWNALAAIPSGTTCSYADVAAAIGRPRAARAVARACATNPVAIVIPCHRVVPGQGGTGGYRWGTERKKALLEKEQRR